MRDYKSQLDQIKKEAQIVAPPMIVFVVKERTKEAPTGVRSAFDNTWHPDIKTLKRHAIKQHKKRNELSKKDHFPVIIFQEGKPSRYITELEAARATSSNHQEADLKARISMINKGKKQTPAIQEKKEELLRQLLALQTKNRPQPENTDPGPVFSEEDWMNKQLGISSDTPLNPNHATPKMKTSR